MTNAIRGLLSLYFGIAVFVTCAATAFGVFDATGPEKGPVAGTLALLLGLAAGIAVYPKSEIMLGLVGLHGNLSETKTGRLGIVAVGVFSAIFIFAVANDEDYLFLSFVPLSLILLAYVARSIIGGSKRNA